MSTELESLLAEATAPGIDCKTAGAVAAFAKADGSKKYMKAFGQPAFDSGVTLKDNAVFWLASMTKLVTAIAILQCLEGVLFQLDSVKDTERLLPEWKGSLLMTDVKPEYVATEASVSRLFTIRELLSHTSGLGADGTPPLSIWRQQRNEGSVWLSGNLLESYLVPLQFEPGTGYRYGGSYELLGLVIERASGLTLEQYFEKNIFQPLGITDMVFDLDTRPNLKARLMMPYSRFEPGSPLQEGTHPLCQRGSGKDYLGGVGLHGTAQEYLKILESLLHNDSRLLKPASVDLMMTGHCSPLAKAQLNQVTMTNPWARRILAPGFQWQGQWDAAFGGAIDEGDAPGLASKGTFQWNGAPSCFWMIDREAAFCGLFLTQLFPPGDVDNDNFLYGVRRAMWKDVHAS